MVAIQYYMSIRIYMNTKVSVFFPRHSHLLQLRIRFQWKIQSISILIDVYSKKQIILSPAGSILVNIRAICMQTNWIALYMKSEYSDHQSVTMSCKFNYQVRASRHSCTSCRALWESRPSSPLSSNIEEAAMTVHGASVSIKKKTH